MLNRCITKSTRILGVGLYETTNGRKQPLWGLIYPLCVLEETVLRQYLNEMIASLKISPSSSPTAAFTLLVQNVNEKLRIRVNYRGLNLFTQAVENSYPLLLMDNLVDTTKGTAFFTKIHMKTGTNL